MGVGSGSTTFLDLLGSILQQQMLEMPAWRPNRTIFRVSRPIFDHGWGTTSPGLRVPQKTASFLAQCWPSLLAQSVGPVFWPSLLAQSVGPVCFPGALKKTNFRKCGGRVFFSARPYRVSPRKNTLLGSSVEKSTLLEWGYWMGGCPRIPGYE